MGLRTLKGTWEQVSAHAEELRGKQVVLTVVDSAASEASANGDTLDALFAQMDAVTSAHRDDNNASDRAPEEAIIEQMIVEKYRRQGLDL